MAFKRKEEKARPRRLSKVLTEAIVSGEEWLETVQIIQALDPVSELVSNQVEGFTRMMDQYEALGGSMSKREMDDGYFAVTFTLRESSWTKVFHPDGREFRDIKEDRSGSTDPDAMMQIAYAMRSALEIPRREFVLEELERLKVYLESSNTMSGVEKMKEVFEQDPAILFESASSVVPDAVSAEVDMSSVVESR